MNNKAAGFTIIEVTMFLAISGMLLIGAMIGMTIAVSNSQFNDTTDGTLSYFQKQYFEVSSGVNVRNDNLACSVTGEIVVTADPNAPEPGASDCVVLGRLFTLTTGESKIDSAYLTSLIPANEPWDVSDVGAFGAGGYTTVNIASQEPLIDEFTIPWRGFIARAALVDTSIPGDIGTPTVESLAIVRSPVSERILVYAFNTVTPDASHFADENNLLSTNKSLSVCLKSDGGVSAHKALLDVGPGQSQDLFTINRSDSGEVEDRCV